MAGRKTTRRALAGRVLAKAVSGRGAVCQIGWRIARSSIPKGCASGRLGDWEAKE